MASDADNLIAARSNLISTLVAEEAYELANGARPSYTLFGESYDFPEWRLKVLEAIKRYTEDINLVSGPFEVDSFGTPYYG